MEPQRPGSFVTHPLPPNCLPGKLVPIKYLQDKYNLYLLWWISKFSKQKNLLRSLLEIKIPWASPFPTPVSLAWGKEFAFLLKVPVIIFLSQLFLMQVIPLTTVWEICTSLSEQWNRGRRGHITKYFPFKRRKRICKDNISFDFLYPEKITSKANGKRIPEISHYMWKWADLMKNTGWEENNCLHFKIFFIATHLLAIIFLIL